MRRRRRFQRIAWLIIAALVVQPWLGLFATASAAQQTNALVICTGTGFKIIEMPSDVGPPGLPSDQRPNHSSQGLDCVACLVQALAQLGAAAPGMVYARIEHAVPRLVIDREPTRRARYSPLQSRAPPVA